MRTFFEITHEIERCLNAINQKNEPANAKPTESDSSTNSNSSLSTESIASNASGDDRLSSLASSNSSSDHSLKSRSTEFNNAKNLSTKCLIDSHQSAKINTLNQAHQQVSQFDDESLCENVLPCRKARQIRTNIAQPHLNHNGSITLKESNTVNNSNYYEISCSYIVKLNNFQNCNSNNRIVEDKKKKSISANINVNNCYKSKSLADPQKLNSTFGSEDDEAYSDATTDLSDSLLECPSYSFSLKRRSDDTGKRPTANSDKSSDSELTKLSDQQNNPPNGQPNGQPLNSEEISELIQQKMHIFNQSLISLTKREDLVKSSRAQFELHELDSNYLEKEELVLSLCSRLKGLVKELIRLMQSMGSGEIDETIAEILNRNAELSARLSNLRREKQQIENDIKNLQKKESNSKLLTIEYKHLVNELKQNEDRRSWLRDKVEGLKKEINALKEEQRRIEFKEEPGKSKDLSAEEEEEVFEDCLESLEDLYDEQSGQKAAANCLNESATDKRQVLFDRLRFENVFKSIQQSNVRMNELNEKNHERFEINSFINQMKNEIEQLALANEELDKEKRYRLEDHTQHLNCLRNQISSNKKFMNQQNFERDNEKDSFDAKLARLNCLIREKELSLSKCAEKSDFLKSDLDELMGEKDELQCKSYSQGLKLLDVNARQEELKQSIDKLQAENNVAFYRQEQLRKRVEEYETSLEKEKLRTDKLKFDHKLELDPQFYARLEKVMNEIHKFQMKEKIREHLKKRTIEKRSSPLKAGSVSMRDSMKGSSLWPTPIKPFTDQPRSKSFVKEYSTPIRTNSFSLHNKPTASKLNSQLNSHLNIPTIKLRSNLTKVPRSKSFMETDELRQSLSDNKHRYSLKLNDDSYSNFVSKLRSPCKRALDDEELYSFKECQSLISLNADLDDDLTSFRSDSLHSLAATSALDSAAVDETLDRPASGLSLSTLDAKRSLSEDTFYFSLLSSEDANNECPNLSDLYAELDKCKDAEKLRHYAFVICNFFRQIITSINACRDALQNTTLDNAAKQVRVAELEKTFEQLKSLVEKEAANLEHLQNELNSKHLELSELKNQVDSNQDNSLFIENKQALNELDTSMMEQEESQFILQANLQHLTESLKRRCHELRGYGDQLSSLRKELVSGAELNQTLKTDNLNLSKENEELSLKLKKLREAKLYKRLRMPDRRVKQSELVV